LSTPHSGRAYVRAIPGCGGVAWRGVKGTGFQGQEVPERTFENLRCSSGAQNYAGNRPIGTPRAAGGDCNPACFAVGSVLRRVQLPEGAVQALHRCGSANKQFITLRCLQTGPPDSTGPKRPRLRQMRWGRVEIAPEVAPVSAARFWKDPSRGGKISSAPKSSKAAGHISVRADRRPGKQLSTNSAIEGNGRRFLAPLEKKPRRTAIDRVVLPAADDGRQASPGVRQALGAASASIRRKVLSLFKEPVTTLIVNPHEFEKP